MNLLYSVLKIIYVRIYLCQYSAVTELNCCFEKVTRLAVLFVRESTSNILKCFTAVTGVKIMKKFDLGKYFRIRYLNN